MRLNLTTILVAVKIQCCIVLLLFPLTNLIYIKKNLSNCTTCSDFCTRSVRIRTLLCFVSLAIEMNESGLDSQARPTMHFQNIVRCNDFLGLSFCHAQRKLIRRMKADKSPPESWKSFSRCFRRPSLYQFPRHNLELESVLKIH